jgi:hypothetical protein
VALTAVVALVLVLAPATWRVTRLLITVTHEGAHAVVALLAGRRLQGIRLHSDTSGLTVSQGRPRGAGMIAMLAAGYLGPAAVGLGAVLLLMSGHSLGLLWLFVAMLALMLLQIRNFFGFALLLGIAALLVALSWYLPETQLSTLGYLLTWVLLLAAPKPLVELAGQRRLRRGAGRHGLGMHSDADQLARLTHLPAGGWIAMFLLADVAGLLVGASLLLPALASLIGSLADQLALGS